MAERPPLEAVIFDAGGTLVRLDFEWMSGWLAGEGHPTDAATLSRAEVQGRRRYDESAGFGVARDDRAPAAGSVPGRDGAAGAPPAGVAPPLGRAGDTRAYLGGMLEAAGVPPALAGRAVQAFLRRHAHEGLWTRPVEGARATVDALRAAGLRLACVSNSDGRAEWHLVEAGMRHGLELVVDSEIEGVEKPDPRLFHLALDRLGVAAARSLYVGDIRCVDEVGARAAGMHFVLIDPSGDYAAPGTAAIREIAELPALLAERFTLVPPAGEAKPAVSGAGGLPARGERGALR